MEKEETRPVQKKPGPAGLTENPVQHLSQPLPFTLSLSLPVLFPKTQKLHLPRHPLLASLSLSIPCYHLHPKTTQP